MELRQVRRAAIALAIPIAWGACGGARGADLEISVPVAADEVDVFVAPSVCADPQCDQDVAWDNSGGKRHGDAVFLLDTDDETQATKLGAGRYRAILLGSGKRDQKVARVLVVAFQQGVAVASRRIQDVIIPGDGAETWDVHLAEVTDVPAGDPPPARDGWRVHAWVATAATVGRCVVTELENSGNLVRELYLRPSDTDCDGLAAARECDPYYYLDPGSARVDQASCLAITAWPANDHTCLVGGTGCSEVAPTTAQCLQVSPEYCAPNAMCDPTCFGSLSACVHAGQVTAIHCTAIATSADVPCNGAYSAPLSLATLVANGTTTCDTLGFAAENALPGLPFDSSWTPTAAGSPKFSAAGPNGTPCDYVLMMEPATPSTFAQAYYGMVDVPLSNGRHDVVPIEVQVTVGACPVGTAPLLTCTMTVVAAGDGLPHCAAAP
jgi:hypothetical protein